MPIHSIQDVIVNSKEANSGNRTNREANSRDRLNYNYTSASSIYLRSV